MGSMFYNCYNLNNINLSSFDTKNVRDMSSMLFYCKWLKKLDLSFSNSKNIKDKIY